jgi:hypothetical protein
VALDRIDDLVAAQRVGLHLERIGRGATRLAVRPALALAGLRVEQDEDLARQLHPGVRFGGVAEGERDVDAVDARDDLAGDAVHHMARGIPVHRLAIAAGAQV